MRRVVPDDWQAYRELRLEALKDSPLAFVEQYDDAAARPELFWRERVEGAADGVLSCMFVAEAEGRLVGKASCFVEGENADKVSGHVVGVYVTPQARGTGVAAALLSATVSWALTEARADRVRLFVIETNDRAAAFYRRIGFVATGRTMRYPPDPTYIEYEMEYRPHGVSD
ncbi:GNAT family N-acetyltransferase [Jiangella mangrovi]|uniref:Ribosomal protein S18 acetylase RimI-like enzyme n=1 Tax=Jiangella mangrovi TaxID=1524084 RepID=A0A7W9GKL1_9ACTN|nr:ribosomal protein S18 acetylase RimI-like enzyme [Jiangella mangrovi]